MKTMIKLMAGAALMATASAANAIDYIRYEILTSGSGTYSDARSGTNIKLENMGFTFVGIASGGLSQALPNGSTWLASNFDLGFQPGTGTMTYTGNVLSLTDRSRDHNFSVNACSAQPLTSLPTSGFGTVDGCSNTVTFATELSRGFVHNYSGITTEIRAVAFSGEGFATGLTMLSAVPEPATWAMMLLGFGMVAGAARYRRRSVKASFA